MKVYDLIKFRKINRETIMHVKKSVQEIFKKSHQNMNQSRLKSLLDCAESLLNGADLYLTSIGRHLSGDISEKNKIRRVDLILGNEKLYRDKLLVSKGIAQMLCSRREELIILVDWSGCCNDEEFILQASLANAGSGRSLPLHKRIYPQKELGTVKAHREFLEELKVILQGFQEKIIVVTDAGFYSSWFKLVMRNGWDFVGRVRGTVKIKIDKDKDWKTVPELYEKATGTTKFIGNATLGKNKRNSNEGYLYLVKEKLLGRKKPKNRQRYPDQERQYSKSYRDPWLLISSLKNENKLPNKIKNIYKTRMQIEQNFRDDKNGSRGFGLEYSRTKCRKRLELLLLIATVATLLAWIVGYCAEHLNLHRGYQANTVYHKRVLSFVFLGKRIWQTPGNLIKINTEVIKNCLSSIQKITGVFYNG